MDIVKKSEEGSELQERVIDINRVAKVVKGGRRFSFTALVAVGDSNGKVGVGKGKAKEVVEAIKKATDSAKKEIVTVPVIKGTLPHEVTQKYSATRIVLKPAAPGTGVIAGGAARAVLESAGVQNVLTKILGSRNNHNVAKAVLYGLKGLCTKKEIEKTRNIFEASVTE